MKIKILILAFLLIVSLSACTLFQKKEEKIKTPAEISQWAIRASASDSYGGSLGEKRDDQSPYAATGQPDVETCGDNQKAWTISKEDDGEHWLELYYDIDVYASKVRIKETFGPGAIKKVEVLNEDIYVTLWEGTDKAKPCPKELEVKYEQKEGNITKTMTPFMTNTVKITLDTDVKDWNEIDAVQLIGYEQKWYMYNQTLFIE